MTGPPDTGPLQTGEQTETGRRRFLASAGSLGVVLFAGCLGDDSDENSSGPDNSSDDSGPDNSSDDSGPDDSSDDSGPDDSSDDSGPDDDSATLERRAREIIELQAAGSFEAAYDRLVGAAAEQSSAADMRQGWEQIVAGSGEFDSILGAEHQAVEDGLAVVSVETAFERVRNIWTVALTDEGVASARVTEQEQFAWDPPSYADEAAFEESTVTLDAPGSCELGGTVSLPGSEGSVPGVVIGHGSGPVDRDGTFGPNRPYKELAWGLASRGVAVLRYDKRTHACDVDRSDATIDDVVTDDALTALERLRAEDGVDGDSVCFLGHSLAGGLAPRIAQRDGALAGVVMLAPGLARPLVDSILDQQRQLLDVQGVTGEERERAIAEVEARAAQVRSLDIGDDEVVFGLGGREYFETLAEYDAVEAAAGLDIPLLLGQGGRDYQVTVEDDLPLWRDALSGRSTVEFEVYDGLNHLFQRSEGPRTSAEYYEPEAVLSRRVVEDIAAFVGENA